MLTLGDDWRVGRSSADVGLNFNRLVLFSLKSVYLALMFLFPFYEYHAACAVIYRIRFAL